MKHGFINSPKVGDRYRVRLSDGQVKEYTFEGFGGYMKQIWRCADTDEILPELPPYSGHEKV